MRSKQPGRQCLRAAFLASWLLALRAAVLRLAVSLLSGLREAVPESWRCQAGEVVQIQVRMHALRSKAMKLVVVAFASGRVRPVGRVGLLP
jgi:hypothetical protein